VAFAVYQLVLFVTGYPLEGSEATLSGEIVARVFEVNLASFSGLWLLQWAWDSFARPINATRHV
jgi:hypothetical protein